MKMNESGVPLDGYEIDVTLVRRLLHFELDAFEREYRSERITEWQDLRAFLIAWFCVFLPEICDEYFESRLHEFVGKVKSEEDYIVRFYYRILSLEIALFGLTGNACHLDIHRFNFDHHKSWIRSHLNNSLAFVADKMSFNDHELRTRTRNLVKCELAFLEGQIVLLLVTKGTSSEKREELDRWLRDYDLSEDHRKQIEEIHRDGWVRNLEYPLFFGRLNQYIAHRLMCLDPCPQNSADARVPLFSEIPAQKETFPISLMWNRISSHPLMQYVINIFPAYKVDHD